MKLDIDLCEETSSNDLPDQTENQVLPAFVEIGSSDVDNRETERFGGSDDKIVVLSHLEVVESSRFLGRRHGGGSSRFSSSFVENSLVDRVGN